jgi:hypothetical protein
MGWILFLVVGLSIVLYAVVTTIFMYPIKHYRENNKSPAVIDFDSFLEKYIKNPKAWECLPYCVKFYKDGCRAWFSDDWYVSFVSYWDFRRYIRWLREAENEKERKKKADAERERQKTKMEFEEALFETYDPPPTTGSNVIKPEIYEYDRRMFNQQINEIKNYMEKRG